MHLYDTLSDAVSEFTLPHDRPVTMYVCGVTPYDTTHVGHARTFLLFDVLRRYLAYQGVEVRYCQNVTDVDDPLFERANRDKIDWRELAEREVAQFQQDCAGLNIIPPDYFPRASQVIDQMIPIIEKLINLGHAYVRDGNVYFSIKTDPDYGAMTRMGYSDMLATANDHGNNPDDPRKEDPLDFVLWQTGEPGDPTWPSPWGEGRPGWHIECTTMATQFLGPQLDIHGGGRDLIFPHHPSEIAQTEPVTGVKPFVRFWMHAGLVWLDGDKMSKSLGNMVFIRDALKAYRGDTIRWYLLSQHYHDDFYYERADVPQYENNAETLSLALRATGGDGAALDGEEAKLAFFAALDNNMDTPTALTQIETLAGAVLDAAESGRDIASAQEALRTMAGVIGFFAAV